MPNPIKKFDPSMAKPLLEYPSKNESLTFLIYGNTKSGKTHFAGTFGSRSYYINIGNGFSTLLAPKFREIYAKLYNNEPYNPIRVDLSGEDLYEQVIDAIDYSLSDKMISQWDTMVIDDASRLQEAAMTKAMEVNFSTERSKSKAQEDRSGVRLLTQGDFGTQMGIMDGFFSTLTDKLKALNKNLVVLAHEKKDVRMDKGASIVTDIYPLFTGNNKITSYFDMVWNTSSSGVGNQESFRARTCATAIVEAGTRWGGVFPEEFRNPNYPEIKKLLGRS